MSVLVLPFSFAEFLRVKKPDLRIGRNMSSYEKSDVKKLLRDYLHEGGFPDIVLSSINRFSYFRDYMDVVIFRDVVERYGIRNHSLIKLFASFAISSFSKEFSINKIFNRMKSMGMKVGKNTLYRYTQIIEDVFLCFFVRKFSHSETESLVSVSKAYTSDTGIANFLVPTRMEEDIGRLMENAVFLELKRKEYAEKPLSIFYFKDHQQREVDFVVKSGKRVEELIQVTYASSRDEIDARETKSLLKASELLRCKNLTVITWDYEGLEKSGSRKIRFVPLWKWLLSQSSQMPSS